MPIWLHSHNTVDIIIEMHETKDVIEYFLTLWKCCHEPLLVQI